MTATRLAGSGFWVAIAVAAIALNAFTTLKYRDAELQSARLLGELDSLAGTASVLKSERRGLLALLKEIDTQAAPLRGTLLDSAGDIDAVIQGPVLVYTIAPSCPACARNLPFLNRLEEAVPGSVLGLSFASNDETRRYATENAISFPVAVNPRGGLMQVFPRHATPVTLVIDESRRLVAFFSGVLSAADESFLRSAVDQSRHRLEISPVTNQPNGGIR